MPQNDGEMWKFVGLLLAICCGNGLAGSRRAIEYLSQEVPRWAAENGCYSCHNNGDGARALYAAVARGHSVPAAALEGTNRWLSHPMKWDDSKDDSPFKDRKLARIQFAAALAQAIEAGKIRNRQPLIRAAELVAEMQEPTGSWQVDEAAAAGSPATYGPILATHLAVQTLRAAGSGKFAPAIGRAERWLAAAKPGSTLDRAALLMAVPGRSDLAEPLLRSQGPSGGWGPQPSSPPEVFDTAVAMLALAPANSDAKAAAAIERGRTFLLKEQLENGGWVETTRPSGSQSYAQHVSTSAWALLALLATDPERN